jgi:hypothetical protein
VNRRSGVLFAAIAVALGTGVAAYVYATRFRPPAMSDAARVLVPDEVERVAATPDTAPAASTESVAANAKATTAQAPVPPEPAQNDTARRPPSTRTDATPTRAVDAAATAAAAGSVASTASRSEPAAPTAPVFVYFRNTAQDANYGKLARIAVAPGAVPEIVGGMNCEVVHVSAGAGVCLSADRGVVTTYAAKIFDAHTLETRMTLPLAGLPSRTRVSKDGRLAATTVFVTGHGYDSVDFSTETLLIDLRERKVLGNVQDFSVTRDGQPFAAEDFNFWGVTFVGDGRHFYATLSTAGEHYLVRGDATTKTAKVLRPGVECPSLSPDGKRIAFKRRRPAGANVEWQIMMLNLATGEERVLSEQRTVDDQLEWLDDRTVLYALPTNQRQGAAFTDVWSVRIDRTQPPRKLLTNAYSPAIDR